MHGYHNIAWFSLYCEAAGISYEKITISIKRCWDIDEYNNICFRLITEWFNTIRQGFNTIVQNLKCMMHKINISLSGVNRLQWNCTKEVTDVLEGQLLYELFYWRWQWPFCRAEKEICCHDKSWSSVWFCSIGQQLSLTRGFIKPPKNLRIFFLILLHLTVFQSSSCL